uniref:Uncharacterized protein n=1 Tax=Anopheles farauti TaxID=69004 RepID=A0A182R1B8_9DIPT
MNGSSTVAGPLLDPRLVAGSSSWFLDSPFEESRGTASVRGLVGHLDSPVRIASSRRVASAARFTSAMSSVSRRAARSSARAWRGSASRALTRAFQRSRCSCRSIIICRRSSSKYYAEAQLAVTLVAAWYSCQHNWRLVVTRLAASAMPRQRSCDDSNSSIKLSGVTRYRSSARTSSKRGQ